MPIASWLLPVLWREHDWRAAIERLVTELAALGSTPQAHRAGLELGHAFEYIEPDRRRAIAVYELVGPGGNPSRARELAVEIGWWSARARLSIVMRTIDPVPRLVFDEAEAWWDAGQPDLCALALAGVRRADHDMRVEDLAALVAGHDLADHAASATARAAHETGSLAADAFVMASRFARAADRPDDVTRALEAALEACPGHPIAGSLLLRTALQRRDPDHVQRYLRLRLAGLDKRAWLDTMRVCALALIDSGHHPGLGLRLLRKALESAYEWQHGEIPGHLAMWATLLARATADGTRRDLLELALKGLQSSQDPVDRVWLGILATEISLRDANNPVVAGAYAEIVAEHAPEHPIVRELVSSVAAAEPDDYLTLASAVPREAVTAASRVIADEPPDFDVDLDDVYATAAEAATVDDSDFVELSDDPVDDPVAVAVAAAVATANVAAPVLPPAPSSRAARPPIEPVAAKSAVVKPALRPIEVAPPRPAATTKGASTRPAPLAVPVAVAVDQAATGVTLASPPASARSVDPGPVAKPERIVVTPPIAKPAITPVTRSIAKVMTVAVPAALAKPSKHAGMPVLPPLSRSSPVLTALRMPDRPAIPPRDPDPPDARKRARRIAIPIDIRLVLSDGTRIGGHSRDISATGLFVLTHVKLVVGEEITIELFLPGEEAFTEHEFRSRARIARSDEGGYGIELLAPQPDLIRALADL